MGGFNNRCVILYSGGLDSLLAVAIMKRLGFETEAIFVETPFYKKDIEFLKGQLNMFNCRLNIVRNDKEYIEMVKNPSFGYGKNMNPCIDCKIFFYKEAAKFMENVGASFVVTGEVLGQRPMSQRSYSVLRSIEKRSNLSDLVLRPLSARCLKPTKMEEEGLIDKDKLFCITGRSRKEQFELAKQFGIENFESPAGGCLLTDISLKPRIKDILNREASGIELELLSIGRHFKINDSKFVVSRNKSETKFIYEHYKDKLPMVLCHNAAGSVGVFMDRPTDDSTINIAAGIVLRYSKKAEKAVYNYKDVERILSVERLCDEDVVQFRIG